MDTWVSVTYSVNGVGSSASIRVTVVVPTYLTALNFPGGQSSTITVTGSESGYLTLMTYCVLEQDSLDKISLGVAGVTATEVLQTTSFSPNNIQLDLEPRDATPLTAASNQFCQVFDKLYATAPGGLPQNFSAIRTQNWTLSGFPLTPQNTISLGQSYATTSNQTFGH